jgi:hypothetical protein
MLQDSKKNVNINKEFSKELSNELSINETDVQIKSTEWCDGYEIILKKEAEQSESLFWLHNKASLLATKNNDYIQIPSIVLQTITGFLSATNGLVPALALGSISIFTGVLTTILSYYKFSARAEGHRVVAQLYMQIYKKLEVELALPISQREDPQVLLKEVRDKLSKISEVAPDIPEIVIAMYKQNFKDNNTSKPIIANGLDIIEVYKEKEEEKQSKVKVRVEY